MGSAIFVSSSILYIRKRAFEKKLEELAARKLRTRPGRVLSFSLSRRRESNTGARTDAIASGAVRGSAIKENYGENYPETTELKEQDRTAPSRRSVGRGPSPIHTALTSTGSTSDSLASREQREEAASTQLAIPNQPREHISFGDNEQPTRDPKSPTRPERRLSNQMQPIKRTHTKLFDGSGVGVRGLDQHPRNARPLQLLSEPASASPNSTDKELRPKPKTGSIDKYLKTIDGYIGRNSQFHNLTEKERRKLGGIEYDAICLLSYVVPTYFVLWQLLGALGVGAWFQANASGVTLQNGWDLPPHHSLM
jgi:hypothetical protein